ncbi:PIN domain-containing protein [Draconibacterium mangrovi]|uniref:PIN domain-containing protein n=1 Tax=Draconibacterium mangrovi TaxID=2697469 RepID=UPI0013CFCE85|nr:hypothetical protein [Draconibacterium mangrovi]
MEPLSSFGISIAAGIALDIYNKSQGIVKKEIEKAFEKALSLWCVNKDIRDRKRKEIKTVLNKFIAEPELLADLNNQSPELNSFFEKFDEALVHYSAAYNYIKGIKDLEWHRKEVSFLSSIKDTVEDTNKKLTDFIGNNLPESSKLLEDEWKRQLVVYKENILNFKPKTALNLLLKLEESFATNDVKPSKSLLSSIEFLKAQCYELIGNSKEMYQSYIKANQLNSATIQIKERACYSYAKIKENEKSNNLIEEILKYDEFNSWAWAVKIILDEGRNLESHILGTPLLVRNDWNFKRLVYLNILNGSDFAHQLEIFNKYEFLNESYDEEPLTLSNYKKALFVVQINLTQLLSAPFLEFTRNQTNDIKLIKNINIIFRHFINEMAESEILGNFKTVEFCYYFSEFVLTGSRESVLKMKSLYAEINKQDLSLLMMLANSLQLIGEIDEAIAVINKQETKLIETIQLEAYCYIKKSDIENYIRVSRELLNSITEIDLNSSESIFAIPVTLYDNNRINDIEVSDFLTDKEFENEELKKFVTSFVQILKRENIEGSIKELQSIENKIFKLESSIRFYIPFSYYVLERWDLAISSFRKYLSTDKQSRDLYFYILALDKSLSNHKELLELLAIWRNGFAFNEVLLKIEADVCRQLPDWDRCLIISEKYLSKYPSDEPSLVLKLFSLNEIDIKDKTEKIKELAEIFKTHDFKFYGHVQSVVRVLIENKFYQIALDILYKKATDNGNIQARMDYFLATTQMPEELIQEKEIVELGSYVKFSIDNETKFLKIDKGNSLAERLLGHKTGDTVIIERPMVKTIDNVQIHRIMNKYLYLHDEILEDVRSNPYSGFPMQSVQFKDTSPEGINKTFIELFGAEGTIRNDRQDDAFKNYYNFNLSFTEIIIQIFNSNYLGGYFNLIISKDGITQIPMIYYPENILFKDVEIVLDVSSLLILHQISREHNIIFEHKFLIAKGVVEYIRASLKKEKHDPKEKMSINITLDGVTADKIPEGASSSNVIYLQRLLEWIESNCTETIVASKLDLIRKLGGKIENEIFMSLLIENLSLVMEKENRILLTDDSIYFKFLPIKSRRTISSELYVKSTEHGNDGCYNEFVKNKYVGHTFQSNILVQEFNKKLKDQPNNFAHCINNTTLRLIPNKNTIYTIVGFLKQMAMNPVITADLFKQESTSAIVNLLKGQKDNKPYRITELLLRKEFKYLGTKLDLVLQSYERALVILGIS